MSATFRSLLLALAAAVVAACAYNGDPLVAHPDGTVDSTHGPNGAQSSPH